MGKRATIFGRFQKSFKNLWKETIKDIIRDFTAYLLENPLKDAIWAGESNNLYTIFWIGEGGDAYARDMNDFYFFKPVLYREDDFDMNFYIFKNCIKYPEILNGVLSEETRVDIKLILDRYFNSLEYLVEEGGITKLKHIYPYLVNPVAWNYKDATIKSLYPDPREQYRYDYIWNSDTEEYIELFGDTLIESKKYETIISCFQNKKKVNTVVKFKLGLDGLKHFIVPAEEIKQNCDIPFS